MMIEICNFAPKNIFSMMKIVGILMVLLLQATAAMAQHDGWTATWACAPQTVSGHYMPYNNQMSDRSVRQVVRVSCGGDSIRLRLSNELSGEPLEIASVYVATGSPSYEIVKRTARYLEFKGEREVTIPAHAAVTSDALRFRLAPLQRLAITINYRKAPADPTVHMGSRTTSYILKGETDKSADFKGAFREDHWFNIASIDVYNPRGRSIAIIGNSITDGKASTTNAQDRWPDWMADMLCAPTKPTLMHDQRVVGHALDVGVLNLGIGGNRVLTVGLGEAAKDRFDHDVLDQTGVSAVIVFEGINDIGTSQNPEATAKELITEYKNMVRKAKFRGLRVYGATITPFMGCKGYYTEAREMCRDAVNRWIRESGEFDGVIDFDQLMRDPLQLRQLQARYQCGDWLHPNAAGYEQMGKYAARVLLEKHAESHKATTTAKREAKE